MRIAASDRRHAARIAVDRPCKLRRQVSARFEQAHTVNVSTSGALLKINSPCPVSAGESLALAIAWDGAPVVRSDAFVDARVVRADSIDGNAQRVAVTFVAAEQMAMAA